MYCDKLWLSVIVVKVDRPLARHAVLVWRWQGAIGETTVTEQKCNSSTFPVRTFPVQSTYDIRGQDTDVWISGIFRALSITSYSNVTLQNLMSDVNTRHAIASRVLYSNTTFCLNVIATWRRYNTTQYSAARYALRQLKSQNVVQTSNSRKLCHILLILDISRYNKTQYFTRHNNFEGKNSVRLRTHERHSSPVRVSYGCLSWVLWRKVTARYRDCTVLPRGELSYVCDKYTSEKWAHYQEFTFMISSVITRAGEAQGLPRSPTEDTWAHNAATHHNQPSVIAT